MRLEYSTESFTNTQNGMTRRVLSTEVGYQPAMKLEKTILDFSKQHHIPKTYGLERIIIDKCNVKINGITFYPSRKVGQIYYETENLIASGEKPNLVIKNVLSECEKSKSLFSGRAILKPNILEKLNLSSSIISIMKKNKNIKNKITGSIINEPVIFYIFTQ